MTERMQLRIKQRDQVSHSFIPTWTFASVYVVTHTVVAYDLNMIRNYQ